MAANLTFYDPDEEYIKQTYANTARLGRGPPEFDKRQNTYTYAIDVDEKGHHKTQYYHKLTIKPHLNEMEILQHQEEDE